MDFVEKGFPPRNRQGLWTVEKNRPFVNKMLKLWKGHVFSTAIVGRCMLIVENSVEKVENFYGEFVFFHKPDQERVFLMMSSTISRIRGSVSMAFSASFRE